MNSTPFLLMRDAAVRRLASLRTTQRLFAAMAASLVFTFVVAPLAAKSRKAELVIVPALDILQSVPVQLLMDEPVSALDVLTAETLRTDLLDLWTEGRMPIRAILIVTHNIEEAVLMSDRILVFSSNPGRIVAEIK